MAEYADKFNSIRLTRFYMKIIGFWYPETEREKWILPATLTYTIAAVIFAICVEATDLYYSRDDFSVSTKYSDEHGNSEIPSFVLVHFKMISHAPIWKMFEQFI